jgi:hypothetical protein
VKAKSVPSLGRPHASICNRLPGKAFRKGRPCWTVPLRPRQCFPRTTMLTENYGTSKPVIRLDSVTSVAAAPTIGEHRGGRAERRELRGTLASGGRAGCCHGKLTVTR